MFKARLKEAGMWLVAAVIVVVIVAIPVGLIELTAFIDKNLPTYIFAGIVIIFWVCFILDCIWKWIKWQFIEPYKAAKAEKEGE